MFSRTKVIPVTATLAGMRIIRYKLLLFDGLASVPGI
jgi:hypothetical protein